MAEDQEAKEILMETKKIIEYLKECIKNVRKHKIESCYIFCGTDGTTMADHYKNSSEITKI